MSDYQHIHPDFRHIVGLSDKERIAFMDEPRWIGYPAATKVFELLQSLLHKPKKPRMPNLLIVGEPNNGKTTIVKHFFDLHGQRHTNEQADVVIPVLVVESPPSADEKGLYVSILEKFFAPYRASDSKPKLRYQAIHYFRACHVGLLIIDEFHSLLTGPAVKQREVMNAIKLFCNELSIPIIGVGTREAVRVLHTDPQHASRFDVFSLPVWMPNQEFQRLLAGFEQILPLKRSSKLYQPQLASLLNTISDGNIGNVHKLLVECATEAIKNGQEHIDKTLIESKAWMRPTRGIRELIH